MLLVRNYMKGAECFCTLSRLNLFDVPRHGYTVQYAGIHANKYLLREYNLHFERYIWKSSSCLIVPECLRVYPLSIREANLM